MYSNAPKILKSKILEKTTFASLGDYSPNDKNPSFYWGGCSVVKDLGWSNCNVLAFWLIPDGWEISQIDFSMSPGKKEHDYPNPPQKTTKQTY